MINDQISMKEYFDLFKDEIERDGGKNPFKD